MTTSAPIAKEVKACRICGGSDMVPYLDLGQMPLVNSYLTSKDDIPSELKFPLVILFCRTCALSQLSLVISPEVLFRDYDYHSSVSKTFQAHCASLADATKKLHELSKDDLVVEIASNDGCLLSEFKKLDLRVRGVEPARNLARISESRGLPTIAEFWAQPVADEIKKLDGLASVVVCTNVLAHVDDLNGFLSAVRSLLKPGGTFIFEVPYMLHFMERRAFDTTYHEHLSYFLLKPLETALRMNDLKLVDAELFEIHGGSVRVTAQPASSARWEARERVKTLLEHEKSCGLLSEGVYLDFQSQVQNMREELRLFVIGAKSNGHTIAAYGASAKGNVLLNYCRLDHTLIDYVVDDTPAKQNKLYPGVHIPIVPRSTLAARPPKYLLLLAWNFAQELMANTRSFSQAGGRYLVPIPSLQVVAPSHLTPRRIDEEADRISSSL